MYAKRNSITIGILWLILMIAGIFWYSNESKKLTSLELKNSELQKQLDGSLEIIKALETVENQYRILRARWSEAPKQIIAAEEPSFSLYYLNWLVNSYQIPVEFDFELKNTMNNGDILTFSFLLSGEGSYHDLYRLIWFINENPILYQVEGFNFSQSTDDNNVLRFSMVIKGFSLVHKLESGQEFDFAALKPVVQSIQFHDAFKPRYREKKTRQSANVLRRNVPKIKPKAIDPSLTDIEAARLQAVANGCAYIKDKKGKLVTLKVGDKVRYGSLVNINQNKSEVKFSLNKDGTIKTVILGLGY